MADNKIDIPNRPQFQSDALLGQDRSRLSNIFGQLTSGDLTGDLAFLQPLVERDPEITQLALQQAEQEYNQGIVTGKLTKYI